MNRSEEMVWDYVTRSAVSLATHEQRWGLADLCKNLSERNVTRLYEVAGMIWAASGKERDRRREDLTLRQEQAEQE